MTTIETINFAGGCCFLTITVVLIVLAVANHNWKEKVFRWFFILLLLNLVLIIVEFLIYGMEGHTGIVVTILIRFLDFISYVVGPLLNVVYALYLYEYLSTKGDSSIKPVYLVACFSVISLILLIVAQFNHMYAYLDDQNYYFKQDTYWISTIPIFMSILVFMVESLRCAKALKRKELTSLLSYYVLPLICYILESVIPELWISHLGGAVAIMMIYVNIQLELQRQADEQRMELAENRITLMLSQIQPHFIFNSLGTISDLYADNPEAQKTVLAFSKYLRVNMDALSQKRPVSFHDELEHVRQYLWLEKLRFEERLNVRYEIQTDQFLLPVLSLQPIVENAVRHGITKRREGGIIIIRTEEIEDCFRILVIDDGIGFDPEKKADDNRSHVAIENVQRRLNAMCDGRLMIESIIGKGTTVTIEIPKGGKTT